ncbi:ABC transporter substrate-binding protein [Gallaecimonas mangrovi]|uniref:ABC transporter substrate-binding protein n=1 Tax=Gallaecimonas mangrovi TaxID=2291597 RepID=UPI000E20C105|nr:ABC transporter substrate-binding protein [Gallaecimonas mangrovi]
MARFVLVFILFSISLGAHAVTRVAFLSPGYANEPYWENVDSFLIAAASDLDVQVEIVHCDRDEKKMLDLADWLIQRPNPPDYVLAVNENGLGVELVKKFNAAKIPIMLVLNDLDQRQQQKLGVPRQRYPYWLGILVPDNLQAGQQLTSALSGMLPDKKTVPLVAIAGDRSTPAGLNRQAGLLWATRTHHKLKLMALRYGFWQQARANRQMMQLLGLYPDLRVVWTADDNMAFGAIDALRQAGLEPGKDVLVGTFASSAKALRLRRSGEISALAGGAFMAPGLALALLVDYQNGFDFANDDGLVLHLPLYHLLIPGTPLFNMVASQDWSKVNFRAMSKVHTPYQGPHHFELQLRATP